MAQLILASASPRRRELLQLLGVDFSVQPATINETPRDGELPQDYVQRLACEKALAVRAGYGNHDSVVLGADTTVVSEQQMLGKPESVEDARSMLNRLSGRMHAVWTGVAVVSAGQIISRSVRTEVEFHPLSASLVDHYLATGEPFDKAGGYGIQGYGARLVRAIHGTYHNVVGLPVDVTAELLEQAGLSLWRQSRV